jgi:septum formation protein
MVLRLARAKARAVAERRGAVSERRGAVAERRGAAAATPLVIAADTTVVLDGEMLGKPRDVAEAAGFVARLAGREHWVHTGHALRLGAREASVLRSTRVRFRALDAAEVADYAATGEGLDKAGGYAIQGVGATLIDSIDGCYGAVVGLSLPAVLLAARELGVRLV